MVLRDYFYDGKWHRSVSLRSHDASTLVYTPSSTAAVHIRQLTNTALSHMYECIHTHKTIREDILLCPRCPVFCIHAEISYRWALRYPLPLGLCKHALIEAGTVDCMVLSHHGWYNAEGQLGHVGHCSWCWEMSREVMTTLQFLSSAVVSRLLQTLSHLRRGADGDGNPMRFGKTKEEWTWGRNATTSRLLSH